MIYGDLPVSYPTGELIDNVCQKWLQFDSIVAFTRYIDALKSMHVYTGCGSNDNFSFHLDHRILHECLRKTRMRHFCEEFKGGQADKNHQRRLPTLEWFTGVLPKNK